MCISHRYNFCLGKSETDDAYDLEIPSKEEYLQIEDNLTISKFLSRFFAAYLPSCDHEISSQIDRFL